MLWIAAIPVVFWYFRNPLIVTSSTAANHLIFYILGLAMPWWVAYRLFSAGRQWGVRLLFALVSVVALIITGMMLMWMTFEGLGTQSFVRFHEVPWRESAVRFYRYRPDATRPFGVVIRQESAIAPGFLLVREIDSFRPCFTLEAKATGAGVALVGPITKCFDERARPQEYPLKPHLYF